MVTNAPLCKYNKIESWNDIILAKEVKVKRKKNDTPLV